MTRRYSLRERAGYRFDKMMSRGMVSKLKLLLTVTIAYIVIVGLVSAFLAPNVNDDPLQTMWLTMMFVLGKTSPSFSGNSAFYLFLGLLSVFYCMFFTAILIGLISQGIRSKVDELGKGRSKVLEEGHVLILGFNEATFVLLGELVEANRNRPRPETVAILDEVDRSEMVDAIARRIGPARLHPMTRIVCRTGLFYDFDDLRRCSVETSRVIVVNATNDFDAIKAIMACSHILNESEVENEPYIVSTIQGEESVVESRIAGRSNRVTDRLELLSLNDILARIMVHTSRQPGLSDVFTELFNYADDEFYIVDEDDAFQRLWGKSVAEVNRHLKASFAVGVVHGGEVVLGAPHEVRFSEGDSLIVVKEDDDPLQASDKPVPVERLEAEPGERSEVVDVLVLGARPMLDEILLEYAEYLHAGSRICVADRDGSSGFVVSEEARSALAGGGIDFQVRDVDYYRGTELSKLLDDVEPDCVLVLVDHNPADLSGEDERAFNVLLRLRDHRARTGRHYSITSEMHLLANKRLAALTEPDDFIISKELAALLVAQISQNRKMAQLFDCLLSSEGFEVYMKPAAWYVPAGVPVDLVSVGEAVADRGEVFIGMRRKDGKGKLQVAEVNPSKYVPDMTALRHYAFGEGDYLVVLAENGDCPTAG